MICDSSSNWSLEKSDIDKLETAIYKLLSDKANAPESDFVMSKFLGYLYNRALQGYGDNDKALTLLRAVPETMKIVITAFDELSDKLMSKKVPLDMNTLFKLSNSFNADINNVKEYVNKNLAKATIVTSQSANEDAKKAQTPPQSDGTVLGEFQALPSNPFTSTGNETEEMTWYYDFLKTLDKRMMDLGGPDKDGGVDFNGRKVYVSMVLGSNIPENQLYESTRQDANLMKASGSTMYIMFTDASGNPSYFSDTYGNATSEDGKLIYFPQRAIPTSTKDKQGNLVFDLESIGGRTLQSVGYAARVERSTNEAIAYRYNNAFAKLKQLQDYLRSNPTASVRLDIDNISRGFMNLQSPETTRVVDVKNITAFTPVISGNKKLINVPGVLQPIEFFMAPYSEEMASKVADLLLNEVIYNNKVMTPKNKFNLIADFTQFGTTSDSFRYDTETGTIFLGTEALDTTDKNTAKQRIVEFLTREFENKNVKNAKGEFVKQKNQFFYNNKKATGNFIDFTLAANTSGAFDMSISTRPYLDWVKENAMVSVELKSGEIRQVNGYVEFNMGVDAMRILATQPFNEIVKTTGEEGYSKLNPTKTITGNVKKVGWKAVLSKATEVYPTTKDGDFQVVSTRIPGTNQHFGNPFSSTESVIKKNKDLIKVDDTVAAVKSYIDWVTNTNFDYSNSGKTEAEVELLKERAHWIRKELMSGRLKGKDILYYIELKEPAHSNALDYLINDFNWGAFEFEQTKKAQKKAAPENIVPSNLPTNSDVVANKSKDFDFGAYKRRGQGEIDATPSQIIKAAAWYDNLKIKFKDASGNIIEKNMKDVIPYHVMFRIANSNGDVRARWTRSGINLYEGSDYSDLYHEAWHGFTQWFLTTDEKLKLYDSVKNSGERIKYYDDTTNSWKSMSASDLDFSIKNHKLYAEEFLAEKFREFALNNGKFPKEQPVAVKSIFRRIWDALKALFGFASKESMLTPISESNIAEVFEKLYVGDLSDYTMDSANIDFDVLNSGITATSDQYQDLNITDSILLADSLNSIISELVDSSGTAKATAALFNNTAYKKALLEDAREALLNRLKAVIKEYDETEDSFLKEQLDKNMQLLNYAYNNFGNIENLSGGLIDYFNKRYGLFDMTMQSKAIDREFNIGNQTDAVNTQDGVSDREGLMAGSGVEYGTIERMDDGVMFLLSTLFEKENGQFTYNKLGFKKTTPFRRAYSAVSTATENAYTRIKMIENMDLASKMLLDSGKVDDRYTVIQQLLAKLGPLDSTDISNQSLWNSFFHSFRFDKLSGNQVTVEYNENGGGVSIKVGKSDGADKLTGRNLETGFEVNKTKSTFLKKNKDGIYTLDLEGVLRKYPTSVMALNKPIEFLRDLGLDITENLKIKRQLADRNVVSNIYKIIVSSGDKNRIITGLKNKGAASLFDDQGTLWNSLLQIQSRYSGTVNDYMIKNAKGDSQSEMSNPSTAGNLLNRINDAVDSIDGKHAAFDRMINSPEMSHYNPERNPFVKSSVIFKRMFGPDLSKRQVRNGIPFMLEYRSQLGTQVLEKEIDQLVESTTLLSGLKSSDSDFQTAFLRDFFTINLQGFAEAYKHADKTQAFIVALTNNGNPSFYVHPKEFANVNGSILANDIIIDYIGSELERIKKVINFSGTGTRPEDIILWYDKKGNPVTYKNTGSTFTIFDDILLEDTKNMLIGEESITDLESFKNFLASNAMVKDQILQQLNDYFADQVTKHKEILSAFPVLQRPSVYSSFLSNVAQNLKNQPSSVVFETAVKSMVYNSFIHKFEMNTLVYGDAAQNNHDKEEHMKRIPGFFASGRIPVADVFMDRMFAQKGGRYHLSPWFTNSGLEAPKDPLSSQTSILKTAVFKDVFTDSVYYEEMMNVLDEYNKTAAVPIPKEAYDAYKNMKVADAQAWMTFDAYRALEIRLDNWSPQKEELYNKIINGENVDIAETLQFFPVKKLQYSGPLQISNFTANAFHKYSVMPLIPNVIKGRRLESLHNQLVSQGYAYGVMHSGSKIASIGKDGDLIPFYKNDEFDPAFTEEGYEFVSNTIFLDYLKEQLVTKDKFKKNVKFPTQLRKLVTSGLKEFGVPTDFEPKLTESERIKKWGELSEKQKIAQSGFYELEKAYLNHIAKITTIAENKLKRELGFHNGKINMKRLIEYVKESLTAQDLPEQTIESIKVDANGKLNVPLDISTDPAKIESLITALVNKRIIDQMSKGEQYIQGSGVGFEKFSKPTEDDLKKYGSDGLPFYKYNPNKPTSAMKVKIALHGDFKKLLDVKHNDGKPIKTLDRLNEMIQNDQWLDTGENRKMITLFGVRIPTQGANSLDFMEVYEFLPEAAGNIMILPLEVVAKSGGDFDIDKLVTIVPSLSYNERSVELTKAVKTKKSEATLETEKEKLKEEFDVIDEKYDDLLAELPQKEEIKNLIAEKKELVAQRKVLAGKLRKALEEQEQRVKEGKSIKGNQKYIDKKRQELEEINNKIEPIQNTINTEYNRRDEDRGLNEARESEIKDVIEKIRDINRQIESYNTNAETNLLLSTMVSIVSRPDNYINLTRPNGTTIFTEDEEDRGVSIKDEFGKYNRKSFKTSTNSSRKFSPTRIMENGYNISKAISLSAGKDGIGMIATGNTFSNLYRSVGMYLSSEYTGKKGEALYQKLFLEHNKIGDSISLSHLMTADKKRYISDVISELMNGYLDVAKDDWVYDINAIKEFEPEFELMILAGVPVRQIVLFLSQPKVRQYLERVRQYGSPYAGLTGGEYVNPNFAKYTALLDTLDPAVVSGTGKKRPSVEALVASIQKRRGERQVSFDTDALYKNLSGKGNTALDNDIFEHFVEIQLMSKANSEVKRSLNFDTDKARTYFEAVAKQQGSHGVSAKVPKEMVTKLLDANQSVLGSFMKQDLIRQALSAVLPLRSAKYLNDYLLEHLDALDIDMDQEEKYVSGFVSDLNQYIFENFLYRFNTNDTEYRSNDIKVELEQQDLLKFGAVLMPSEVVDEETGEVRLAITDTDKLLVDKKSIKEQYDLRLFTGNENKSSKKAEILSARSPYNPKNQLLAPLPETTFSSYGERGFELFYKFVLERETLRALMPYQEVVQSKEFIEFLKMINNNTNLPMRYEEFLRNKALDNLYIDSSIFAGENKQNLVGSHAKFEHFVTEYPELITNYPVLEMLVRKVQGNKTFFKLLTQEKDGQVLTSYKDQMLQLADPGVSKVKDKELNRVISAFFEKLPTVGFIQGGNNTRSGLYVMSLFTMDNIAPFIANNIQQYVDVFNKDAVKTESILKKFSKKYDVKFSTGRDTYSAYLADSPQSVFNIEQVSKDVVKEQQFDYVNMETGELEPVKVYDENLMTMTSVEFDTIAAENPDSIFVFDDQYPIGGKPNKTPTNGSRKVMRKGLDTNKSFGIYLQQPSGQNPNVDEFEKYKEILDQQLDELLRRKNSGSTIVFPSKGVGIELLGFVPSGTTYLENKQLKRNSNLYVYLSKRLLKDFGYVNPMFDLVSKGFSTELLEGAETGLDYIQNRLMEAGVKQKVSDSTVLEYIKNCKG
jgi:hypothetical protein